MTNGERLLVLTSADSHELTAPLLENLAAWCRAGLLGNVVWSTAGELSSHGYEAPGWASLDGVWNETTVGEAMAARALSKVTLAALRHPERSETASGRERARHEEEAAHVSVSGLLGAGVSFASVTVGVAAVGSECTYIDSSPLWDLHLIHDIRAEAHERGLKMVAAQHSPMELCAMVALCAYGGWKGSSVVWEIPADLPDGPTKPVRFVHCQTRVLLTPSAAQIAMPSSMPTSPPWPLPKASGTERAAPTAVPPLDVVNQLAKSCDFRCEQPPTHPEPSKEFVLIRLWRDLFRPVPTPMAPTEEEAALRRLAHRTGGFRDEVDLGLTPLKLDGVDNLISLEPHIRSSDFPLPDGSRSSARASQPTPYEWQTLREAMFGLVDGGPFPGDVPFPQQGMGGDAVRLVWTDPAGVAPALASADASDVFLGSRAPTIELAEEVPSTSGQDEVPREGNPDTVPDEPRLEPELGVLATALSDAGRNDTLMVRMADTIHGALQSAYQGFRRHAAVYSIGVESGDVAKAQKWARRLLKFIVAVLAIGVVAGLDSWRPFIGPAWEFATPWEARRILASALWPFGWLGIGILVLAGAVVLFSVQASRLSAGAQRVREANAERRRLGTNACHYASELLRLRSVAEQFADHRTIITEFLYRPFGGHRDAMDFSLLAPDLRFANEPPPSMLVACAEPDPENVDALLNQQQAVSIQQGWLNAAYRQTISVWSERYRRRVVGEFEGPDHDATPPGTVVHRNPSDGSGVFGARTDFLQSVVGDPSEARGGWAVRKAADERFASLLDHIEGGVGGFLGLLGPLVPVHGGPGAIGNEPARFMTFGGPPHWFDWSAVLAAGARAPRVDVVRSGDVPWLVPNAGEGHSLVLAWRMDVSSPVWPQDLAGWQAGGGHEDPPEQQNPKQVV